MPTALNKSNNFLNPLVQPLNCYHSRRKVTDIWSESNEHGMKEAKKKSENPKHGTNGQVSKLYTQPEKWKTKNHTYMVRLTGEQG